MKSIYSKIVCGALSMLTLLGATSCGDDFLKEEAGHKYTDALLETQDGALAMAAGLYGNIRWHFGYEWAYGITLYGCDEFTNGATTVLIRLTVHLHWVLPTRTVLPCRHFGIRCIMASLLPT